MSANTKAKSAAKKGERNPVRRNGKAWKKRECGFRHAPGDACRNCLTLKAAAKSV